MQSPGAAKEQTVERVREIVRTVRRVLSAYGELDERQVESAAIEPLLGALGWDPFPWDRRNQYRVDGNRKVDIALGEFGDEVMRAHVFIECKRPGKLSPTGEGQLFEYARGKGVPLLVLTDGKQWDLYLAMAAGEPRERRFESLDIVGDEVERTAEILLKYLEKTAVIQGKARRDAEERMESGKAMRRVEERMETAWAGMLRTPDEAVARAFEARLVEGLPESLRPEPEKMREQIAKFLVRRAGLQLAETDQKGETSRKRAPPGKARWRHRGESEWRHAGVQAKVQVEVVADIARRIFDGDGEALRRRWEQETGDETGMLRSTEEVERQRLRGYDKVPGAEATSVYVSLSWDARARMLRRLLRLEKDSPIEIEYAPRTRENPNAPLVWRGLNAGPGSESG